MENQRPGRLDAAAILAGMDAEARILLRHVEIHPLIDSTNSYLMRRAAEGLAGAWACLAEQQSAGRGRQGRRWISPPGANLYLSLLWRRWRDAPPPAGLSLAAGVAVVRALHGLAAADVGLKWPNDLLWRNRKLGGILLEFGGESAGSGCVVAGVGINVAVPEDAGREIDQPWTDLGRILGAPVSRNRLAARVLSELVTAFARFEAAGLAAVRADWERFDLTAGRPVRLSLPTGTVFGIARGVDRDGALVLETSSGIRRFTAGEVSLRLGP